MLLLVSRAKAYLSLYSYVIINSPLRKTSTDPDAKCISYRNLQLGRLSDGAHSGGRVVISLSTVPCRVDKSLKIAIVCDLNSKVAYHKILLALSEE